MAELDGARASSGLSLPVPLGSQHRTSYFDCGVSALNDWLHRRALGNQSGFSRTYVACEGDRIAGYYSISAGAIERGAAPGKIRRNAPEAIPVALIGRLAVDRTYAGRGLGADLLADALRRILSASQIVGLRAVLIHAKDDTARRFYLRCAEFIEFPEESRTLYLPIETIAASIG